MPIDTSAPVPAQPDSPFHGRSEATAQPVDGRPGSGSVAVRPLAGQPALTVSHSALTFAETAPDQPRYAVLTIAQTGADTPVTLTTDAPDQFQFATDSHPNFTRQLTFTPTPAGSYVHVRYLTSRAGAHQGQLFIETPYETGTITLEGRTRLGLPALRMPQRPAYEAVRPRFGGWRAGLLGITLAGGLAWGGYHYRCALIPGLCTETAAESTLAQTGPVAPPKLTTADTGTAEPQPTAAPASRAAAPVGEKLAIAATATNQTNVTRTPEARPIAPAPEPPRPAAMVSRQPVAKPTDAPPSNLSRTDAPKPDVRPRQSVPDPSTEESDLEKELNGKP